MSVWIEMKPMGPQMPVESAFCDTIQEVAVTHEWGTECRWRLRLIFKSDSDAQEIYPALSQIWKRWSDDTFVKGKEIHFCQREFAKTRAEDLVERIQKLVRRNCEEHVKRFNLDFALRHPGYSRNS